jgi:hypothetical protein
MRCIYCGADSKYKDRSISRRCSCGRSFAFEPTKDALKITDVFFQRVIEIVSNKDSLFFTERQLWYELCRRIAARPWWRSAFTVVAVSFFVALVLASIFDTPWPFAIAAIAAVIGGLSAYLAQREKRLQPAMTFEVFGSHYLGDWVQAHGPISRLLPRVAPRLEPLAAQEPDVTGYSFDRLLVTADASIAAMLVANNFHFEHNCAVLSVDGYPAGRAEAILAMLRRNPALAVYALHDASAEGCQLPLRLRRPEWFPGAEPVIFDLGLRPRHVIGKRWMTTTRIPPVLPDDLRRLLTPPEAAWLETGKTVELAVMRPAALLLAVYRSIARAAPPSEKQKEGDGGNGDSGGGDIWIHTHVGGEAAPEDPVEAGDLDGSDFDGGDAGDIAGADSFG